MGIGPRFETGQEVVVTHPLEMREHFKGAKATILAPLENRHGDVTEFNVEIEGHPHPDEGSCYVLEAGEMSASAAELVVEA